MDFSGWELTSVEKFPETCINARLRGTKGEVVEHTFYQDLSGSITA